MRPLEHLRDDRRLSRIRSLLALVLRISGRRIIGEVPSLFNAVALLARIAASAEMPGVSDLLAGSPGIRLERIGGEEVAVRLPPA